MELRSLDGLAKLVIAMVILNAVNTPLVLLWIILSPQTFAEHLSPNADLFDSIFIIIFILTAIVFGRWMYVAGTNLEAAGHLDLEFSPGARIWWFAVPLANFVMPYRGMRELWTVSHGETAEGDVGLIGLWWALWLGNGIVGWMFSRGEIQGLTLFWVMSVLEISLAAIAIVIVRGITSAQNRMTSGELEEVFA